MVESMNHRLRLPSQFISENGRYIYIYIHIGDLYHRVTTPYFGVQHYLGRLTNKPLPFPMPMRGGSPSPFAFAAKPSFLARSRLSASFAFMGIPIYRFRFNCTKCSAPLSIL
ncbi:hypothetical protein ACB092_02G167200 [Castanea dentata]